LWLVLLAGCHVRDYSVCLEPDYPCADGLVCNEHNQCVHADAGIRGDGGQDLSVGDLAMGDGSTTPDGGRDLGHECDASLQCGNLSQPICTATGQCRGCKSGDDAQCAEHAGVAYCEADAGRCVECTTSATCPAGKPVCGSDDSCRLCANDDECATGICLANGSCAAASDVVFVDNHGQTTAAACKALDGGTPDGSRAAPFCGIQDGIDAGKLYVRVAGHALASYDAISVTTNKTVIVVGPLTGDRAIIFSSSTSNNNVKLQVASGNASLTLIRMQVGDPVLTSTQDNLLCNGTVSGTVALTLLSSAIYKSGMHGVNVVNCTVTLDADRIAFNGGGGVLVSQTSKYSLTNNFIYRNSGGTAVVLDQASSGLFQFNTVANNSKASGFGGIDCGSTPQPIEASIFVHNLPAGSEQFGCNMINDDVEGADPLFTSEAADDYSLKSNSPLIDLIKGPLDGGAMTLTDHDIAGTHRPAHAGYDTGAYEVP
jgi:hypothetical protein